MHGRHDHHHRRYPSQVGRDRVVGEINTAEEHLNGIQKEIASFPISVCTDKCSEFRNGKCLIAHIEAPLGSNCIPQELGRRGVEY
jgi:hypothetical protein